MKEYAALKAEIEPQRIVYNKLQRFVETPSMIGITRESWRHVQNLWKIMEKLVS